MLITKQSLRHELDEARQTLLTALRALPEETILRPKTIGEWSVKDVAGHIFVWENRLLTMAQKILWGDGDKVDWIRSKEDLHEWNAQQQTRLNEWTWSDVIRELALQREETDWNLTFLSDEQMKEHYTANGRKMTIADMFLGIAEHDREHLAAIEALK